MGEWVESDVDVTDMLQAWQYGDEQAFRKLVEASYQAFHGMARRRLAGREQATLTPTALVNETFVVLLQKQGRLFQDRDHFLAVVSLAMRDVVGKRLRARRARKRGGDMAFITFDEQKYDPDGPLDLTDVIRELSKHEPRKALIVLLRYYDGLSFEEIARLLSTSERTVYRDWKLARMWLYDRIKKEVAR